MPAVTLAQSSLVAGELTPLAAGRSDQSLYKNGAEILRNFAPLAQGGVETRPGLRHVAMLPGSPAGLIDFVFDDSQRYILALSPGRLDGWRCSDGAAIAAVTGCPWTADHLAGMLWTREGDTLILCHEGMRTQTVKRTGALAFAVANFAFEVTTTGTTGLIRQPYHRYADPAITLTPSATTGSITVTASASLFVAEHAGVAFRIKKKQFTVTAVTNATTVSATCQDTLDGTSAEKDWDEAAFSPARGWPRSAGISDNRLIFAGARDRRLGFWTSKIGAFFNFDLGTAQDTEAIWEGVGIPDVRQIFAVVVAEKLLLLTDAGIVLIPVTDAKPLTPKNVAFRLQGTAGAAGAPGPLIFDGGVLFVDKTRRGIVEGIWEDTAQSYRTASVSILAEHLVNAPVRAAALSSETKPERFALFVQPDGTLSVFHSIREQKVAAWVPWTTDGVIGSVAVAGRQAFVTVQRFGTWRIERFDETAAPLDAAVKATLGSPGRTFSGFGHLIGKTLAIWSRGRDLGDATVAGDGTLTLPAGAPDADEIEAGLTFAQYFRPMPVDVDLQDGASIGKTKSLIRVDLRVDGAGAFSVDGNTVVPAFQGDDFTGAANTLDGVVSFAMLGASQNAQFDLVLSRPQRIRLLSVGRRVKINR